MRQPEEGADREQRAVDPGHACPGARGYAFEEGRGGGHGGIVGARGGWGHRPGDVRPGSTSTARECRRRARAGDRSPSPPWSRDRGRRTHRAVRPGHVTGFLGPNGAGKTTTLRMLPELVDPIGDSARIGAAIPWSGATSARC
ncbi:ATP-binding cassette domain-containing protein [Streptomyces sp. NPDC101776]|uniref:ATP-binding cassette domain-containing protein n=1 Tax=Streptomyces sp. NPDC101776 TaxID=3366146 RepID=UPI0038148F7A